MDPSGFVFLARAYQEIGRAKFGDDWTDCEPYLPGDFSGRFSFFDILKKEERQRSSEESEFLGRYLADSKAEQTAFEADPDRYRAEFVIRQADLDRARSAAQGRSDFVVSEIVRNCEGGTLLSYCRAVRGGAMRQIPEWQWNGAVGARFYCCEMSIKEPFSRAIAGGNHCFIFIERNSLDHFLATQPFAVIPHGDDLHLSPYLKVMLHVVRNWSIGPENQHTKEAIQQAMVEAWAGPGALSENLASSMATLRRCSRSPPS